MAARSSLFLAALVCVALVSLSAQQAVAACITSCEATLVLEGCVPIGDADWPPSHKFQSAVSCTSCCPGPAGSEICEPEDVDSSKLALSQVGVLVEGSFMELPPGAMCPDELVVQFTPHLAPGDYTFTTSQTEWVMSLAEFTVHKPPCTADDQCMACEACIEGGCTWTGIPSCATDADCPEGQLCYVDDDEPCYNGCGDPPPPPCETDADCGPCDYCQEDGSCITPPGLPPECDVDADCEDGMTCIVGDCTAYCAWMAPQPDATTEEPDAHGEPQDAHGHEPDADDVHGHGPEPDPEPAADVAPDPPDDDAPGPAPEVDTGSNSAAPETGASADPAPVADTTPQNPGGSSGGGGCSPAPAGPATPAGLLLLAITGLAILRRAT